ncbi:Pentatricopeptide repeat-containing protein [Thalictrum thalictroides]|uniref:Pentatricopeptide repeat-containing protein n=1 Tax=Thalictrum thalictroides TaxID=46969 RepID=A0A7J6X640_THATH|nr:Pentatricopeptide repeat-containing protein [Thalictrum thalictroides]
MNHYAFLGLRPDHFTFPFVYKACVGIGDFSCFGCNLHSWVGSSILDFYAKGGNLIDARRMFSEMSFRDTVVWNSMISGYTRAGFSMDSRTIPSILSACGREGDLLRGKEVHGRVVQNIELKNDVAVGNALIDMYAKCGCLDNS